MGARPESFDELSGDLKRARWSAAGWITTGVGAAAGLGLYFLVGCQSGACLLASTWWSSTLYGVLMAHLVRASFGK